MGKNLPDKTYFFDKGQVTGLHRAGKSTKEVSEMTAIGVRTVRSTIPHWKKYGKVQSFSGNRGRTKILNARDKRSLKQSVK